MSGSKSYTVWVDDKEWAELMRACSESSKIIEEIKRAMEQERADVDRKVEAARQAAILATSRMDADMQDSLRLSQENIAEIEADKRRAIQEIYDGALARLDAIEAEGEQLSKEDSDAIDSAITEYLISSRESLQQTVRAFESERADSEARITESLDSLRSRILSECQGEAEIAQYWIDQSGEILSKLTETRHNLFYPGRLQSLRDLLGSAEHMQRTGNHQAAAASSLGAYRDLVSLMSDLVLSESKWGVTYEYLVRTSAIIRAEVDGLGDMMAGGERFDASQFSRGEVQRIKDRLDSIDRMLSDSYGLSQERLDDTISEIESIRRDLEHAKTTIHQEFSRFMMREALITYLTERFVDAEGWEIDIIDNPMEPADGHVEMTSPTGDRVAFNVVTDENGNVKVVSSHICRNRHSLESIVSAFKEELNQVSQRDVNPEPIREYENSLQGDLSMFKR